ncbi:MAG: hypothetical protein ACRDA5_14735 [Clostridium sp.]
MNFVNTPHSVSKLPNEIKYFTEDYINSCISIPNYLESIKTLLSLFIDIKILSVKLCPTDTLVSNEGQVLTGFNLLINYSIKKNLKYISNNYPNNPLFYSFATPYNYCSIALPSTINGVHIEHIINSKSYSISYYLENVDLEVIDERNFFYHIATIFNFYPLV